MEDDFEFTWDTPSIEKDLKIKELEKQLELRTNWTNHHKRVSEIDAQKVHNANKRIEELEKIVFKKS